MLRRRDDAFLNRLADAAAQARGPREAILGFFDILHDWFAEPGYRGCPFLNAFAELGSTSPAVGDVARRQKQRLQRHLEALVSAVGGPLELAGQLLVLANGRNVHERRARLAGGGAARQGSRHRATRRRRALSPPSGAS